MGWRGRRVLGAGCGQAHFSIAVAARGFAAEAVDWAPRTVERLRVDVPEIHAWTGDVRALDVPAGRYDVIYPPGVCEHFEAGPEPVLQETYRVLAPGRIAIVSTPCFSPLAQRLLRRAGTGRPSGSTAPAGSGLEFYQYAFPPDYLSRALRDCGFEVLEARPFAALATLLDFTSAGRWVERTVPRLARLPVAAAMELAELRGWAGRGCVWVARRPLEG